MICSLCFEKVDVPTILVEKLLFVCSKCLDHWQLEYGSVYIRQCPLCKRKNYKVMDGKVKTHEDSCDCKFLYEK